MPGKKGKNLGNPMVAAALISEAGRRRESKQQSKVQLSQMNPDLALFEAQQRAKRKNITFKVIGLTIGGFVVFKVGQKLISNLTDKSDKPEVQYAKRLKVAMSPSGIRWLPDGTNEDAMYKIAYEISANPEVDFANVQNAYKKLYNRNLTEDIQSELDSDEFAKFSKITAPDYDAAKDRERPEYIQYGKPVFTVKEASIYKEKDALVSYKTLEVRSTFVNAVTTGRTYDSWLVSKRIEIKKIGENITRWLNLDEIGTSSANITMPMSNSNMKKLTSQGVKLYKL